MPDVNVCKYVYYIRCSPVKSNSSKDLEKFGVLVVVHGVGGVCGPCRANIIRTCITVIRND